MTRSLPTAAIVFALAALFVAPSAAAQTVAGRVVDRDSHAPVPLVVVHVLDTLGTEISAATADSGGVFYALLPGAARVSLTFSVGERQVGMVESLTVGADEFNQHEYLVSSDAPLLEFQVEKPVSTVPGTFRPKYPTDLKQRNAEGRVLASFVVRPDGRADMQTFQVLQATDRELVVAVKAALVNARFYPAELGGRKVAQLVQQPFTFAIQTEIVEERVNSGVPANGGRIPPTSRPAPVTGFP